MLHLRLVFVKYDVMTFEAYTHAAEIRVGVRHGPCLTPTLISTPPSYQVPFVVLFVCLFTARSHVSLLAVRLVFTARCYADRGYATVCRRLSVRLSVRL